MKDKLLTLACVVCLLISFTVIVSWARSIMSSEGLSVDHGYSRLAVEAAEGEFVVVYGKPAFADHTAEQAWLALVRPGRGADWNSWSVNWQRDVSVPSPPEGSILGFGFSSATFASLRRFGVSGVYWHRVIVEVPHWAILLLTGPIPGIWLYRRHRQRRERLSQGLCQRCGFEMGAVYHSCPKCGERAPLPDGFPVIDSHV